ncbi:MAG: excinuclease subunit UvrA [Paenibacillus sp.]|jgi:hypothetical protein|nr:excinuclease subunit UvrA [Paenibacillus sp.]
MDNIQVTEAAIHNLRKKTSPSLRGVNRPDRCQRVRQIESAYFDWLIEMGPGSGDQGGRPLAAGSPQELVQNPVSLIGPYLPIV